MGNCRLPLFVSGECLIFASVVAIGFCMLFCMYGRAVGARDSRTRNRQSLELLEVRVLYLLLSLLLALYVIS